MNAFNKLLVNWKSPTHTNYAVATLELLEDQYRFKYNKEVFEEAKKEGFSPFVGLSKVDQTYNSDKLFSIFDRRIPNKERTVFRKFMEEHNLDPSKNIEWNYLSITKGTLATDSISFVVPAIYFNEKETLFLACEVAGWSFNENLVGEFDLKDKIGVVVEDDNVFDAEAISLVLTDKSNLKLGYIPRPYNKLFNRIIKKNIVASANIYSKSEYGRPLVFAFAKVPKNLIQNELDLQYMIEFC
ncbi:HIRAN domain-containing protein [Paenibacillus amylolyticus]|uniref:HIRAN domain-containing protein n=1 Tax=Paenibacillus amylolyticus TaxID=1451 RepID=UPI00201D5415|nr:HIRAN domain-containing protein [Paenibacillus amylolyticus]MCL6663369.1 HIRAN domain-containing protein [Paenibacillus amylolyticus]